MMKILVVTIMRFWRTRSNKNQQIQQYSYHHRTRPFQFCKEETKTIFFVQDPPAATAIEVHNPNHKSTDTKQLDDLLDKTMKKFDDKWSPLINTLNLSLAQQKESRRKLSKPTNSAPVIGDVILK